MAIYSTEIDFGQGFQAYEDMEIVINLGGNQSSPTTGTVLTWANSQSEGNIVFGSMNEFEGRLAYNKPNPNGPVLFRGTLK